MTDSLEIDDCWKRIGVWSSSRSCLRLAEVAHCRNCEVYSAAGRILLEREFSAEMGQQASLRYALPTADSTKRQGTSFTVFRVGSEWLAVPTRMIERVGDPVPVRRIPHRSNPVLRGMGNFFGEIELVVSLEALLGIESTAQSEPLARGRKQGRPIPRMLLLGREAGKIAFVVAEVLGTWRQDEGQMGAVPSTLARTLLRYVHATMAVPVGETDASARGDGVQRKLSVGVLDMSLLAYSLEQALK